MTSPIATLIALVALILILMAAFVALRVAIGRWMADYLERMDSTSTPEKVDNGDYPGVSEDE